MTLLGLAETDSATNRKASLFCIGIDDPEQLGDVLLRDCGVAEAALLPHRLRKLFYLQLAGTVVIVSKMKFQPMSQR